MSDIAVWVDYRHNPADKNAIIAAAREMPAGGIVDIRAFPNDERTEDLRADVASVLGESYSVSSIIPAEHCGEGDKGGFAITRGAA